MLMWAISQTMETKQSRPRKGKFTTEEDKLLQYLVSVYGVSNWRQIGMKLNRTARQCRERYMFYLDPNICERPWTVEEDMLLKKLVKIYENKWMKISLCFEGRTHNDVKNRWMTRCANDPPVSDSTHSESPGSEDDHRSDLPDEILPHSRNDEPSDCSLELHDDE